MALGLGSIAFTGFNADGDDDIAFVAIDEITAGTVIYFTDNEWDGAAFNTGESTFAWTAGQTIAAGTIVRISSIAATATSNLGTVTFTDASNTGISNSNEILYAYVGAADAPTAFLSAVANDGLTNGGASTTNTGLVAGTNAIDLGQIDADADIGAYTGTRSGAAAIADYRGGINTAANWITQDASGEQQADGVGPDVPFSTLAFTLAGAPEAQTVGFAAGSLAVSQAEGDAGTTTFTFTVERSGGTTGDVAVLTAFTRQTTDAADYGGTAPTGYTAIIPAGATSATITVAVAGDALVEGDESFGLRIASTSNSAGIMISIASAAANAVGTIENDDMAGPPFGGVTVLDQAESLAGSTTVPVGTDTVRLVRLGSIEGTGATAAGRAESVAYDASTGRVFTTNAAQTRVDVFGIAADGSLSQTGSIDLNALPDSGGVNSVAVKNGVLAVAYESETAGQPGHVSLYDAATLSLLTTLDVGVLPDQLTFSPDGTRLLVANEGETLSAANNPAGGVSIINLSNGAASASVLNTIGFTALDGSEAALAAAGLNLFPGQAASADIEPEYITVSPDGTRAYVTLQEVNAVAVIDLTDATATAPLAILPLGAIDRTLAGNAFDASDRDGISLENFDVASLLQPDAIASYEVGGITYFITANEGDSRVGVSDEVRLSDAGYVLDATAYPNAAALKSNTALGRLNVIRTAGDTDGDGDIDQITTHGGRGISIFRQNADGTIDKVRETGGEFEAIFAANFPGLFNSENGADVDGRSDNKGPEPEGVAIGIVNGRTYAFVTLERAGGVITYDVTDPADATYVGYTPATNRDYAPEVVTFVSAEDSPTGQALVLSANEGSGTLTVYAVDPLVTQTGTEGGETLTGDEGRDRLAGLDGNDRLRGFGGNDVLLGGSGNDTLEGGAGSDRMEGGAGNDTYFVDASGDVVVEAAGEGTDTVRTTLAGYTLGDNVEVLQFETAVGSSGTGNALGNTLFGNAGSDTLSGLAGEDRLVGGGGDDVLTGGAGRDTLEGGAGADRFVFATGDFATLAKPDVIRDFDTNSGDVIDLGGAGATSFIGFGAFTGSAGQVRAQVIGGSTFVYGDVDGDGVADFAIQLTGVQMLTGDDFVL
jgi:Ca2+-binding RTX toxin-like protein